MHSINASHTSVQISGPVDYTKPRRVSGLAVFVFVVISYVMNDHHYLKMMINLM